MRNLLWKTVSSIDWKREVTREYMDIESFEAFQNKLFKTGHLAKSFNDREEWMCSDVFAVERRGYWDHLYIGGPDGVRHILCNYIDDDVNHAAAQDGYVADIGRKSNTIEQRLFKEFNGISEREAFGYSEPLLNKCVPKQLYYINSKWINKKITCAGKADFSSHYPAHICGRLPNWDKRITRKGTVDPTPEYPFVFYTKSGHSAELGRYDTHAWMYENISGDLFGRNYSKVAPDDDISIMCPTAKYTLDKVEEFLYNTKVRGDEIDGIPAKIVSNSAIGYKHLKSPFNTRNRLYHLAAVCIARANQTMIDLYNKHARSVLQIIVDCVIYMGPHTIGSSEKTLGGLYQEITDNSFIMRGVNQYMFINRSTGQCSCIAHSGLDMDLFHEKLEDIKLWRKSTKS